MTEIYRLFGKGLRWSYRKYGTKGAVAFLLVAAASYYVLNRKFEELTRTDTSSAAGTDAPAA